MYILSPDWEPSWFAIFISSLVLLELWHHWWSIQQVRAIDQRYASATLEREVDIVDHPPVSEFASYWAQATDEYKRHMFAWGRAAGGCLNEMVRIAKEGHISEDFAQSVNPNVCVPLSFWFRTFNTVKLILTQRRLTSLGFQTMRMKHVHFQYFTASPDGPNRPLLLVYPQFSGEFEKISVFAELNNCFDVLFVLPLGTQLSWWHRPSLHSDSLAEYLPIVTKYNSISVVTWSAGNLPFQVLDRYMQLTGLRDRIKVVVRLDPLGYPSSNFLVYSGIPLSWVSLWKKFVAIGAESCRMSIVDHFGCMGFAYLLKSSHGYTYMKLSRMLRTTKFGPGPYSEHLFMASCDPTWARGHAAFDHDRAVLCTPNVCEHLVDGFHGLWLNWDILRERVFPVLVKHS